jgi:hypothetical protein
MAAKAIAMELFGPVEKIVGGGQWGEERFALAKRANWAVLARLLVAQGCIEANASLG